MKNFKRHVEVVLIKLQSVVVTDENEVCGTCNRKQMNLSYRGVKWIVDELGPLRGPAVFVVNDSTEVYV